MEKVVELKIKGQEDIVSTVNEKYFLYTKYWDRIFPLYELCKSADELPEGCGFDCDLCDPLIEGECEICGEAMKQMLSEHSHLCIAKDCMKCNLGRGHFPGDKTGCPVPRGIKILWTID